MAVDDSTLKACCFCKQALPLTSFYRSSANKDGRQHGCNECRRLRKAAWREANPEEARAKERARPPRVLSVSAKAKMAAYRAANRKLVGERGRQSRLKKLDHYRACMRAHKRDNPERVRADDKKRRARKFNAPGAGWTEHDVWTMAAAQHGECAYCPALLIGRFHRDHIKPLSKGGAHEVANLQLLCGPCNLAKGAIDDPARHARKKAEKAA
jgi:5-methylcytosine-specific restriction endonuclease McrA